jgi:2-methylisocitrate lyase-like PEP mutase family enzyme
MTGNGSVSSDLGLLDCGIATYTDMIDRVGQIAEPSGKPFIADAGYGGSLNMGHTIRGCEAAGAAAKQRPGRSEDAFSCADMEPKSCTFLLSQQESLLTG